MSGSREFCDAGGMNAPALRQLIILRHAKAEWPDVPDEERPLATRGLREAPVAGAWLRGRGHRPDYVICSPARRTRQTWSLAAEALAGDRGGGHAAGPSPVDFEQRVYRADVATLLDVLREAPPDAETVLLVGHNPAVHELATTLAGSAEGDALERVVEKFPTAALAVLTVPGPWSTLAPGQCRLVEFVVPRARGSVDETGD
jgi:phosphohistidine phosphatase